MFRIIRTARLLALHTELSMTQACIETLTAEAERYNEARLQAEEKARVAEEFSHARERRDDLAIERLVADLAEARADADHYRADAQRLADELRASVYFVLLCDGRYHSAHLTHGAARAAAEREGADPDGWSGYGPVSSDVPPVALSGWHIVRLSRAADRAVPVPAPRASV
ncbi:hypothetical protein K7472_30290 [Streptomyces sp. PTM05]|uniref:Uncharacterized protein n=1 Tax=Streptantibioticus parmotrematis TaxID=2873249 RepID=A0ABS7R0V9_9ACTN|nr:hypothetical protein [Streptantibioticus parmotrematis]MBY8889103.1 hypothetical protein [Streptantibioticus parmotrematis]